jgi:ribosomal-protein-alanine acetyltransferase
LARSRIEKLGADRVRDAWLVGQRAPEAAQWSLSGLEQHLASAGEGWVALADNVVAAFLITRLAVDELEILNLAVLPECRRRGFGKRLLERALREGRRQGARRAYLEVRASNSGAIAFYKANGFSISGRRPSYYTEPVEDAFLMERTLPN